MIKTSSILLTLVSGLSFEIAHAQAPGSNQTARPDSTHHSYANSYHAYGRWHTFWHPGCRTNHGNNTGSSTGRNGGGSSSAASGPRQTHSVTRSGNTAISGSGTSTRQMSRGGFGHSASHGASS
jgi:hypothetical protein